MTELLRLRAHRLSTSRRAGKIVVIQKGRTREVGTHEELVTYHGPCRRLQEPPLVDR
jgi:ABC-type multidrug transport system fused ATPase/permease subunit